MTGNPEPLPILVGLSGKRDLRGQESGLRRSIEAAFAQLDSAFPHAPKVLVTGLAEGADMLAAEVAVDQPQWRVMGLLPLGFPEYLTTMTDDAARERLTALLARPHVQYRTLASLDLPALNVRSPEIADCSDSSLHYEQLGLWLAERTAVMLAVLPAGETADRLGGTARVVLHRLSGAPDALGRAVTQLSNELAPHSVLDPPRPQPVWTIDLTGKINHNALPSMIIDPGSAEAIAAPSSPSDLAMLFPLAADIDRYNHYAGTKVNVTWPQATPEATDLISSYRVTLSKVQGKFQSYWKRCIWLLSIAFISAVLLFEVFAKLTSDFVLISATRLHLWAMPGYMLIVTSVMGLYLLAAWRCWQATHEDYRAVNEVLRVQRAWWLAGLTKPADRADHHYLLGADEPLGKVRQLAAAIITWARLFATAPRESFDDVHGTPRSYVEDQCRYFRRRSIERERELHGVGVTSWFCFALAFGTAGWLTFYSVQGDRVLGPIAHAIGARSCHGPVLAWALTGSILVLRLLSPTHRYAVLQTAVPGVLLGAFVLPFLMYDFGHLQAPGLATAGKAMVLITMVGLLAVAGGVRFISEKLAWEAEAQAYKEANARFSYAAKLLDDIDTTKLAESEGWHQKRVIVYELGLAALAENESWLRAHRERPIEPVLGG